MKKLSGLTVLTIMGMVWALTACQSPTPATPASTSLEIGKAVKVEGGSYQDISASELHTLMKAKDFTLINVHIPFEGNLPKTDLSVPYDTIGQNIDKLPGNKNSKIVLYCRSGRMSTIAAKELVKLGYTHIWNLDGGMAAWQQAGQSIEK